MLIPGIKLGPQDWQHKLDESKPQCVEIWYWVNRSSLYRPMFQALRQKHIPFGLHFWGITPTGHEANLAYPGPDLTNSVELIHQTIKDAGDGEAVYVNIHSGNTRQMNLNLNDWSMLADPDSSKIPDLQATQIRNTLLKQLGEAARNLGVELQVELVPQAAHNHNDRTQPIPEYPASPTGLLELCQANYISFTNDFCHTFAYNPTNFESITRDFAQYTRIIHANTLTPPYNGTDEHRGILPNDFAQTGVFPSKQKFISLLKLIKTKAISDIWIIGEPQNHHVKNYLELTKILETIR